MSWLGFIRLLGIVAGLAGLICWFHEMWLEAGGLVLVVLARGLVLRFEDGAGGKAHFTRGRPRVRPLA
jgi:hypothetical protein